MTANAVPASAATSFGRLRDLILPVSLIGSVLVILVPMPAAIMDVLLAANITVAVIVLLTTIYVRTPLEFSVFPSLLLATTLGRLVLNVATTRLILTRAETDGLSAAGHVVKGFGEFVAGDKIAVGLVMFIIIVVIQFVVITKGATRISEVAARFALDGMPGRQMAVDADLNAGLIDDKEAQRRRGEISQQADFFGAMDGASKFVRGDAVAGILITLVNIVGGLVIGVMEYGMPVSEAASVFTKLTIGDGLVTQIPAFLISLAAGLLVTRSSSEVNLPKQFVAQLFSRPQVLAVAGVFLGMLVMTNLPSLPLLAIGGGCTGLALVLTRRQREAEAIEQQARTAATPQPPVDRVESYLCVDPMEIEIGLGLIRLADPKRGGDLLERIQRVRQHVAADMGLIMPMVRVRDNMRLDQNQYRIKISDMPVAEGRVYPGTLLAIDSGATTGNVHGAPTQDPVTGAAAISIDPAVRDQAELHGYTVVEPISVLTTHVTEVVRRHADEIFSRDAAKHLLDELKKTSPTVVEELVPGTMRLAEVHQVLQMLLREEVPIRQLGPILEALGEGATRTKNPLLLAEYVRRRLARTICTRYRDRDQTLQVVTLDSTLEESVRAGIQHAGGEFTLRLDPRTSEQICQLLEQATRPLIAAGRPPVVLVGSDVRYGLKQLTASRLPRLVVLAYEEITRDTKVESMAMATDAVPC